MQTLNLAAGDPLSLTLAADARLSTTDYTDDQIWELRLGGGEPSALAIETTYGLRAYRMRLFPRFLLGSKERVDPAAFYSQPRVMRALPNYLMVRFEPFEGLQVTAEYWALESQVITGRMEIANHSILTQYFQVEWAGLLTPHEQQGGLVPETCGPAEAPGGYALFGETGNLYPVVWVAGGPKPVSGPLPALSLSMELVPGARRVMQWAAASLRDPQRSLEAARQATMRAWDAEITRLEMQNISEMLQIETGSPDWDAALALTQKTAYELLMSRTLHLPHDSFVLTRRPDQGYSVRGDGADHPLSWSGQSALDAYYLTSLLLPGSPELAAGFTRNFLATQDEENGRIAAKPGLGGQRARWLEQPLLAALALKIAPYVTDRQAWLREVYPGLLRFFDAWMRQIGELPPECLPTWEHPMQSGLEDSPIFDRFSPEARGLETSQVESPALAAMLYHESQCLAQIAREINQPEDQPALQAAADRLKRGLTAAWDPSRAIYTYRDPRTHLSLPGMSVITFQGSGEFATRRRFKQPRRLAIRLEARDERTYAAVFTIRGFTPEGEVSEVLPPRAFSWLGVQAHAITQNAFLAVERVEVDGLGKRDRVRVTAPDYAQEDCSLLLPLWAGVPEPEQAAQMVETALLTRFRQTYGIAVSTGVVDSVSMLWNQLIGEGLLRYGYRKQAGELLTDLMDTVVIELKRAQGFRQGYNAHNGKGMGDRGHLHGLAPLGLFLQTLGIQLIDPKLIILDGLSPLHRTITVQYRKVYLTCYPDRTEIQFPGGQQVTIDRPGIHRITLL